MSYIKRVNNEIDFLLNLNKYKVSIYQDDNIIDISVNYNNNYYNFIFDSSYPFKPPKEVKYNNIDYFTLVKITSVIFIKLLTKMYGQKCLCCDSIICGNIWNPSFKIINIIDEIDNIVKIKQSIIEKRYIDKIKLKFLISDINLDQYIY